MWNSWNTAEYNGMIAETKMITGYQGQQIHAYESRPIGEGPFPGIVLIPHIPGWDEFMRETARRFTAHGYHVIVPNIYERFGHGTPVEIAKKAMDAGIAPDETVMGDTKASLSYLKNHMQNNGKVGVIGMCSGGRHTFLAACTIEGFDAAVDCWGGGVVMAPEQLSPSRPVAPIDYAENLSCPLLGIFGNEDFSPVPADVDLLEETLKKYNKDYTFYRYDGAGHGIWYYDKPMYRQQQAMDSWEKCMDFFDAHLKV